MSEILAGSVQLSIMAFWLTPVYSINNMMELCVYTEKSYLGILMRIYSNCWLSVFFSILLWHMRRMFWISENSSTMKTWKLLTERESSSFRRLNDVLWDLSTTLTGLRSGFFMGLICVNFGWKRRDRKVSHITQQTSLLILNPFKILMKIWGK